MHANAADDAHEIWHGRAFEMRTRRFRIAHRYVRFHHVAGIIHEIAVFRRDVIFIFLND